MDDIVYVYTDEIGVIYEIDFKLRGDLVQYDVSMIPRKKAQDIINLNEKRQQNANVKKNKYLLISDADNFTVEKLIYIYYHFKKKNIRSITPRIQQNLEEDESLRCGLTKVDSLIKEFIDGTKNMLNYKVNNDGALLYIEEIKHEFIEYNFLENIPLLEDYIVNNDNEDYIIEILYDNKTLKIQTTNKEDETTYQLFFVSKTDKTNLYASLSFNFIDDQTVEIPLSIPNDYIVISSFKKIMKFTEIQ